VFDFHFEAMNTFCLQVPVFDFHFEAMNTFRFIGFLLDEVASSACPALWDRCVCVFRSACPEL